MLRLAPMLNAALFSLKNKIMRAVCRYVSYRKLVAHVNCGALWRSLLSRQLRYVSYRKLVAHVSCGAGCRFNYGSLAKKNFKVKNKRPAYTAKALYRCSTSLPPHNNICRALLPCYGSNPRGHFLPRS